MARRVSIVPAQNAPHFVVRSEDQEIGRFGSLGAAFEAAQAAGAVIRDDERRALELWLLGERSEVGGPGPSWLREVVSPGQRNWEGPSRAAPYLHRLHCGEDTEVDDIDVASLLPIAFANSRRAGR